MWLAWRFHLELLRSSIDEHTFLRLGWFCRTVYYAEYNNFGEGANLTERVSFSHALTQAEAEPFLTKAWIDGTDWLPFQMIWLITPLVLLCYMGVYNFIFFFLNSHDCKGLYGLEGGCLGVFGPCPTSFWVHCCLLLSFFSKISSRFFKMGRQSAGPKNYCRMSIHHKL